MCRASFCLSAFFRRSLKAVCAEGSSPRLEIYFYLRSKRNWITFYSGEWNGKESFVSVPRIHNVYQTSCALWRTWVILRVPLRERMEEFCRSAKCVSPLQIRLADKAQWVWIAPSIIRFVGRDWKFILLISSCVAEFTTQFSNLIPSDSCFLVQIFSRVLHNAWRELKIRLKCKTTARHKLRKFYHIFWQHQQFIFTFLPPSAFYTAYESVKSFTDCIAKAF